MTRWSLPPGVRSLATVLPHPSVHISFTDGRLAVTGVGLSVFTHPLVGSGYAFGVKFRPGGFRPLARHLPLRLLNDRSVAAGDVFGADADRLQQQLRRDGSFDQFIALVEEFIRARRPPCDPVLDSLGPMVQALLLDPSVTRVGAAARRFGISPRSLQRIFREYVGVSPKWVLGRYRLHEAARLIAASPSQSWAQVAAELGFCDQAHFTREFTRAIGQPPGAYAAECMKNSPRMVV
jgi:AraC-like DNA-binding protein